MRTAILIIVVALIALVGYRISTAKKEAAAPVASAPQGILVKTARARRGPLREKVVLTGSIRPINEVDVYPKAQGRIESLHAKVGDAVKAGQLLAVIEHRELSWQVKQAEAAILMAKAGLNAANIDLARIEKLAKDGNAPAAQLDGARSRVELAQAQLAQAEAAAGLARVMLDNARVTAPISGVIYKRIPNVGAMASAMVPLFTIQDASALKLEGSVDAADWARLKLGQAGSITVDALAGREFPVKVSQMAPALDPATRRAVIEVEVDNKEGLLIPNMFAHAQVETGVRDNAVLITREAVLDAPGGSLVYRVQDGRVNAVKPVFGPQDGNLISVLRGVNEGDELAITALSSLADGALVRVAESVKQASNPSMPAAAGAP